MPDYIYYLDKKQRNRKRKFLLKIFHQKRSKISAPHKDRYSIEAARTLPHELLREKARCFGFLFCSSFYFDYLFSTHRALRIVKLLTFTKNFHLISSAFFLVTSFSFCHTSSSIHPSYSRLLLLVFVNVAFFAAEREFRQ